MSFTHVSTIVLGPDPERALQATAIIIRLGYPNGQILLCPSCKRTEDLPIDDAAKHTVNVTWPRCCGKKMLMTDPFDARQF